MRISIDITDDEKKILENDLLDVEKWVQDAIKGKINKCMGRMAQLEREKLKKDGATSMPVDEKALALELTLRPEYKSRKQRED